MSNTHTDSYTSSLNNLRGETAERHRERATDQLDALAAKAEKRTCEQGCNGCDDCTDTDLEWDFSLNLGDGSGKDGIETVTGASVGQLVNQTEGGDGLNHADVLTKPLGFDLAVHLTGFIANANEHNGASEVTGMFSCGGKNYLVVGTRAFTFDELSLHGVITPDDEGLMGYVAKFIRKVMNSDIVKG